LRKDVDLLRRGPIYKKCEQVINIYKNFEKLYKNSEKNFHQGNFANTRFKHKLTNRFSLKPLTCIIIPVSSSLTSIS